MSLARGTPFDDLFAALTEKMGVLHTAAPDTDPSQRDRVEWRKPSVASVKRGYRRGGGIFVGFLAVTYQVSVYGATELETIERVTQVAGWIDYLVGPPQGAPNAGDGYQIGKSHEPARGGDGDAAGYASTLPITLYLPVFQQVFGARAVSSVSLNVVVLKPDGATPTGDPLNPQQASA